MVKNQKTPKPKTGLSRCLEIASDRKPLVILSAVLSSLAAIASFIPYLAIYGVIKEILSVYPKLDLLDTHYIMLMARTALGGILLNIVMYFLAILCSHLAAFGTIYELKTAFAKHLTQIPLAVCVFITIPLAFLIILASKSRQKKLFRRQNDVKLEASARIQEYLEGVKIIKACGVSGKRHEALDKTLLALKKMSVKTELAIGIFISGASMILQSGIGITIYAGCALLLRGKVELLTLLMFLLMATRIYGPILAILGQLSTLMHLDVVTGRMRSLMTADEMSGTNKATSGKIEISNARFGYNNEEVIHGVSFTVDKGSITALVGPSGSGKSTITKLIARFWDVNGGCVKFGGMDIKNISPSSLMKHMSFVFQDVTLFNDTIFNNIKMGREDASDEEVYAAAKAAFCDEFVTKLPQGYDTVIGENGGTLSGGERQRISIARALLKDAEIIILDEATASLDPENELFVQQAIAKLVKNKTVIMIAHRLRTVADADKIIVFDGGRIAEQGTHKQLMSKDGIYRKMYELQMNAS
ncbi:MAG: ABC transporter ATP-binding protein/permease [Oscillospiraceae bacterium]|nr:ABC transporter ATP-binding protein/permease [Oscillospiraceae bacterium]